MFIPMIDTLVASIDIEHYDDVVDKLTAKLEEKKIKAREAMSHNSTEIITIKIGEMEFEVLPNGKKGYAYILHNDFYEIDIAQYRNRNKDFYPVFIKIKSECLWSYGPGGAWSYITYWVNENIGNVISDKLSRIDLCCHIDDFKIDYEDMDKFKGLFYTDCIYRYRRKINAMTFGSSASNKVYCRIYDKVLEIKQKKTKKWFFDIWKEQNLNPNKVWNIEFQICREFLKEYKIDTVEQAFESLKTLWEYCTETWLVKIERDNENISRCSINQQWKDIQKAFDRFCSKELIKREKQLQYESDTMIPAIYGNITTFAAKVGITNPTLALIILREKGERYLKTKKQDFQRVVKKKESLITRNTNIV